MLKTIKEDKVSEIIVKKSRFIANIFYIENEERANEIIKETSKKYFDAKHNCFAYRVKNENSIIEKYSDDKEPSGTAGQPILNVLKGENLENILVIVTRYFGGTLLGTGGLVKAYTDVTKKVIEENKIIKKEIGNLVIFEVDYQNLEKLSYFLRQNNIKIVKTEFLKNVEVHVEITDQMLKNIEDNKNEFNFKILDKKILEKKIYINVE